MSQKKMPGRFAGLSCTLAFLYDEWVSETDAEAGRVNPFRVLLIDGDETVRASADARLTKEGYAVVAERWLRSKGTKTRAPQTAFAAGELAGIERASAEDIKRTWRKAWRRVSDDRLRTWM